MDSISYLIAVRRALHQIPEVSDQEHLTGEFIALELKKMGFKYKRIHTGIVCDIAGKNKQKTIALRADMDALPLTEKADCDFKSTNGCMHACGHDGHMAILLETARLLSTEKPNCNIRLIFQYGEEGDGGAEKMIARGAIDGVDEIYAFHLCPELEVGHAATDSGAIFAGTVEFDVLFHGKSCHCASPSDGADAVKAATRFVSLSNEYNEKYKNNTLFHVGKLTGGTARNVVASGAKAECTLRYYDTSINESVMMNIERALIEGDSAFGTTHTMQVLSVYPPLVNSEYAYRNIKNLCPNIQKCEPRFTAEDFAFYTQKIDGCMIWIGCKDKKYSAPLHSEFFGFNEEALLTGVEMNKKIIF